MGHTVIRQPDGKLAVWSSVSEGFVVWDATPEEVASLYAEEARQQAHDDWMLACRRALETGTSNRTEGGMTWAAAQARHVRQHGEPFDPSTAAGEEL